MNQNLPFKGFLLDLAKDLQTLLHSRQRRQSSGHTTNLQMDPTVQDLLQKHSNPLNASTQSMDAINPNLQQPNIDQEELLRGRLSCKEKEKWCYEVKVAEVEEEESPSS